MGDIICKKFETDEFFGIIECICQETSNCKVRYTDNDIEVITKHEALLHRVYYDSIWKTGCESIAAAIQNGRMKNNIGVFESEKGEFFVCIVVIPSKSRNLQWVFIFTRQFYLVI